MSSSEENFDLDNVSGSASESDNYVPIKKAGLFFTLFAFAEIAWAD
jgi:hypothetical protein